MSANAKELHLPTNDPDCFAFVAAIKKGEFDEASQLLARDKENKFIQSVLQVTTLIKWLGNETIDLLNQQRYRTKRFRQNLDRFLDIKSNKIYTDS